MNESAASTLAAQARADLAGLSYPAVSWVTPGTMPDGAPVHATIVVGAGQSGLAIAAALRREGVADIVLLDGAPAGREGVWDTFARMEELRTPKGLNGMEFGCPSLSVKAWYTAHHGAAAWEALDRIPRKAWAGYLAWYRATLGLPVEGDTFVTDIREAPGDTLAVTARTPSGPRVHHARTVVIATGYDGAGGWTVPDFVRAALPGDRYDHTNGPVDFAKLRGRRVAVLGHGASAFDNANAALEAGAARVDLCFRRARLPRVNPYRHLESAGMMTHYPALDPAIRWQVARHIRLVDQPPPRRTLDRALADPRFHLHPASPWGSVALEGDAVVVDMPRDRLICDHLLCATGAGVDLATRPELTSLAPRVALWRDRYAPPAAERDDRLGAYPFLGADFAFLPRDAQADWVTRVFCFNGASGVSHGLHATSISGHRHALPRLVRGVTNRLFAGEAAHVVARLTAYADIDLDLAEDFEERHGGHPHLADALAGP
ncbi:NAD(P)/FAD-dependent oxidoreductase [Lichenihabitans sp. Uapishka_5]|uniref:NAD(P)/FAD-dependent oxidoreductase n=1 Tax=Lichenihabitans sp. Uapishka_5 TaxID=3037302 RepID=UPI0029E826F2|nr:NAD(P)/FAD-dependent oxidoreductase [Lichenihabitans sp. Uapishka_5]MDX7953415.1 NAD(P)/FAD-dependent oxidoreductase [Lichenihabitans sp. Uapishka_5]